MSSSSELSDLPGAGSHIDALKLRIAATVAPAKWSAALERLGDNLRSGQSWEEATDEANWRASAPLRSLINAALQSGHPADMTLRLLQRAVLAKTSWRELMSALSYPTILLVVALLVASLMGALMLEVADFELGWNVDVPKVQQTVKDFQDMAIGTLLSLAWGAIILLTVRLLATPNAWLKVIGSLPVIGKPYRWLYMSDMLSRLAAISEAQPSLPRALRLTADSYGGHALTAIANCVADRVEQGIGLRQALHQTVLSDERAGIALTLIDMDESRFSQSIEQSSSLLAQMATTTCSRLKIVLPLFVLLVIASLVWSIWSCYLLVFALLNQAISPF
jgi:type II secretory pathway component PulF